MNFLAQNTRPDISFAVHQCAKFCNNLRHSHGIAVKRIGSYLKATADKGLILCPDGTNQLNAYVDADFVELGHMNKLMLEIIIYQEQAMSLHTADVLSIGKAPWKNKLLSAHVRQNTLLSPCVVDLSSQ